MDMQAQFVHVLEEQAGLDEATAERVAHVAMDFTKEHGSEFISQSAPESLKSMIPGESAGGIASEGAAEERVSGAAGEVGSAAEERVPSSGGEMGAAAERVGGAAREWGGAAAERVSTTPGEVGATEESGVSTPGETTATEEGSAEHPGGIAGLFSKLTGH